MKKIKKIILAILVFVLMYALALLILPKITIQEKKVNHKKEIEIYLKSNGVHTDVVLPIVNPIFNWNTKLNQNHTLKPSNKMQYIGIGWGDKGFYLNTPTWDDLTFKTAFKAAFGLSSTALHTTYYQKINESDLCYKILLTQQQYKQLCTYIVNSAVLNNNHFTPINTNAQYGNHDAFYEAKGTYSIFKSCNTWTNRALKTAEQKACLWTILDTDILNKYKK
ncbi:TIGR02117 family protein [Wenyingzhuangia sp. IMCC45574]